MKQANLGLIFFPAFDWMISPGHPERQERLLYTRDQLTEEGLFDRPEIREYRLRMAEINDLQRAHVGVPSIAKLITPAHLASAGGCMTAADAVMIRMGARCTRALVSRMKQAARRRGAITSTCRFYPAAAIRKYTACLTG